MEQINLFPEKDLEFSGEYRKSNQEEVQEKFLEWLGGYEILEYREVFRLLDLLEIDWEEVGPDDFGIGLKFDYNGKTYLLPYQEKTTWSNLEFSEEDSEIPKEIRRYLASVDEEDLDRILGENNFSAEFWADPVPLYHATKPEEKNKILRKGILASDESRGLSNRSIGAAVFTSTDPNLTEAYGSLVFEIDTAAMKANGYMPEVSQEPQIEESHRMNQLAAMLGIQDYHYDIESGMEEETVIIDGNVPRKYLKVYSE